MFISNFHILAFRLILEAGRIVYKLKWLFCESESVCPYLNNNNKKIKQKLILSNLGPMRVKWLTNFIISKQILYYNFLLGYNSDLGHLCSFHLKAYVNQVLAFGLHPAVILWFHLTVIALLVWDLLDNCPIIPYITLLGSRSCQSHT